MKGNMKKNLLIAIFIFILTIPAMAILGTAGGAAPFLRSGAGARALSLSGAFTAYYDDAVCSLDRRVRIAAELIWLRLVWLGRSGLRCGRGDPGTR